MCNVAPVLKIIPPGGSLGSGKRRTVPKIWRAVPIFLARVNGVLVFTRSSVRSHKRNRKVVLGDNVLHIWFSPTPVKLKPALVSNAINANHQTH